MKLGLLLRKGGRIFVKFGCTIPFDIFTEQSLKDSGKLWECFGSKEMLFENLGKMLDVVEFSTIWPETNEEKLYAAVLLCNRYGLFVTFHGTLEGVTEASDFFSPYILLFDSGVQCAYNITVHPLNRAEDTELILRKICEVADKRGYPVQITLENQRYTKGDVLDGGCGSVAEIVKKVHSKRLGICFDFGHQLSNVIKYGENADRPDNDFFFTSETYSYTQLV